MTYKNIATFLNTEIIPNTLGESVTIKENLSNIVELGKLVSNLSGDDLKDFKKKLVVGVHNEVINRVYASKNFKILKDAVDFGGGIQRVMASDLFTAKDSHLLNLTNGTSYLDGKFYGFDVSSKVYTETKAFKVIHSISDDDFSMRFMNADDTRNFIGLLMQTEENTINIQIAQLSKRVLLMAISKAYEGGRFIPLVTSYNQKFGTNYTYAQILSSHDIMMLFSAYVKEVITRLVDYMTEINKKYNDGTVVTFTPKEKINVVLVNEFSSDIEFLSEFSMYNIPKMPTFETVNAWQNNGDTMLPSLDISSTIEIKEGEETKTFENVVGCIYDIDSMGITIRKNKVTVEPVGTEGFTNFHHHLANNYYVDTRLGTLVLTLD